MPTLWLLRHAPVQAEAGLCYGQSDLPASAVATHAAARKAAGRLPSGTAIHTSPLRRCSVLAQALQSLRPQSALHSDARLAEMDFGAWEGRPWSGIARFEFDAWMRDFANAPAGGSGESLREFMARVAAAHDDWRARGEDALWVTHAGVIRAVHLLHAGVREVTRAEQWPSDAVAFGELIRLQP